MLVQEAKRIISEYDIKLTLRQIYYRLVAALKIKNVLNEYKNLSRVLTVARLNGEIPFTAIEDRSRTFDFDDREGYEDRTSDEYFEGVKETYEGAEDTFKSSAGDIWFSRWYLQPEKVVVLLEKDALRTLVKQVTQKKRIDLFAERGYSSVTKLYELAQHLHGCKREINILYLGDFDPSGLDIERYVMERISENFGIDVTIERIALTKEQIDNYHLPPMPAKSADSRYEKFVSEHGDIAVELDAIDPKELQRIISEAIDQHFDDKTYKKAQIERAVYQKRVQEKVDKYFEG